MFTPLFSGPSHAFHFSSCDSGFFFGLVGIYMFHIEKSSDNMLYSYFYVPLSFQFICVIMHRILMFHACPLYSCLIMNIRGNVTVYYFVIDYSFPSHRLLSSQFLGCFLRKFTIKLENYELVPLNFIHFNPLLHAVSQIVTYLHHYFLEFVLLWFPLNMKKNLKKTSVAWSASELCRPSDSRLLAK
jgi:hypothetical protein